MPVDSRAGRDDDDIFHELSTHLKNRKVGGGEGSALPAQEPFRLRYSGRSNELVKLMESEYFSVEKQRCAVVFSDTTTFVPASERNSRLVAATVVEGRLCEPSYDFKYWPRKWPLCHRSAKKVL